MPDTLRESAVISSPLNIKWSLAWWASDPDWTNPGNGNVVSLWRNAGSFGARNDAVSTSVGTKPTYYSSVSSLNNRAGVRFTAASTTYLYFTNGNPPNPASGQVWAHPTIGPPFSIVAIWQNVLGGGSIMEALAPTDIQTRVLAGSMSRGGVNMSSDTVVWSNAPSFMAGHFSSPSAAIELGNKRIDFVSVSTGGFGGKVAAFGSGGSVIGARYTTASSYFDGYLAFLGVYDGDLSTHPLWSSFKQWAQTYYAIPSTGIVN